MYQTDMSQNRKLGETDMKRREAKEQDVPINSVNIAHSRRNYIPSAYVIRFARSLTKHEAVIACQLCFNLFCCY